MRKPVCMFHVSTFYKVHCMFQTNGSDQVVSLATQEPKVNFYEFFFFVLIVGITLEKLLSKLFSFVDLL